MAVTVAGPLTLQVGLDPAQVPPPHEVKLNPASGVAVRVIVPVRPESEQVPVVPVVQLMTASELVIVPSRTMFEMVME